MTEGLKKAYDFHGEIAKQLITLSTIVIGSVLAAARIDEIDVDFDPWMISVIVFLVLSVVFGILHIGALASACEREKPLSDAVVMRIVAILQQVTFVLALIFLVISF